MAMPAGLFPQAPRRPPTFEAGVDVTRLNLTVTGEGNRFIAGLSEGDFTVFEDGVRQELSAFTRDPLPLSVALLVDCSGSMEAKLRTAQEAGVRFVKTLHPEDLGQVVQFNERISILQDFTADQRTLEAAIRGTQASGSTALYSALYVTLKHRAIVLLSDGEDPSSTVDDEQVLELSRQADVGVYAIAIRPERIEERQRIAYIQATHFLTSLTRDTGGEVYLPNSLSELDAVYGRVAEELRSQYTLGYVSGNGRRDGKWRRIVVKTREGLQVRHKLGYYAAKG